MITNYFDKQFEIRYFEVNKNGIASPTTILTLLEETAAEHCDSINYNLFQLEAANIGWVLVSGVLEMERYPNYKEKIRIRTWLSEYTSIKGIRENIIYDEENNVIGRAKGIWVFFDIERRRPAKIFDEIKEKWSFCSEESISYNVSEKILVIDKPDCELEFKVNRHDTDMNKHVNNIKYLQWVLESVPEDIINNYYLHSIDGRFIAEANYGQTILSLTKNDIENESFIHTIKTEGDDKVCATAKTIWRKL